MKSQFKRFQLRPAPDPPTFVSNSKLTVDTTEGLNLLLQMKQQLELNQVVYIFNLHEDIANHIKLLESVKINQANEVKNIEQSSQKLFEKSEEIKKTLAKLQENHNRLVDRAAKSLKVVNSYKSLPLSNIERQFNDEMEEKMKKVSRINERLKEVSLRYDVI